MPSSDLKPLESYRRLGKTLEDLLCLSYDLNVEPMENVESMALSLVIEIRGYLDHCLWPLQGYSYSLDRSGEKERGIRVV